MTQEQVNKKILEELNFMHSKFEEQDKFSQTALQEFNFMHSKFEEQDKFNQTALQEFNFMHSKFDEQEKFNQTALQEFNFMHSKFEEQDNKFKNLSRSIAVIEVEHGKKIDTLIDITSGIIERLDSLEKSFESNVKEVSKHSDQIWNLESKAGIV